MGDSSKEKLKETGMYHQNICNQRKDAKLVSEIWNTSIEYESWINYLETTYFQSYFLW